MLCQRLTQFAGKFKKPFILRPKFALKAFLQADGQRRGFASLEAVTDWLTSELKESGKKINNDRVASQPGRPRPRASLKEVTRRKTKRVKRSSQ